MWHQSPKQNIKVRSQNLNVNFNEEKKIFNLMKKIFILMKNHNLMKKKMLILTPQFLDFFASFPREEFFVIKFRRTSSSNEEMQPLVLSLITQGKVKK